MGRTGELTPEQSELRDQFGRGLAAFRRRDWDEAQTEFERCLRTPEADAQRSSFSNVSPYCAAPRHRPIGTGFGIFPKNEGR